MKVEKCPRCKLMPDTARSSRWFGWWIFHIRIYGYVRWEDYGNCAKTDCFSLTKNGVYRKWNRWARREAKRIAKEGATK